MQLTVPFRANIVTDFSYEVFGEDKHNVYYGTYRCAKRVTMDWDVLVRLVTSPEPTRSCQYSGLVASLRIGVVWSGGEH